MTTPFTLPDGYRFASQRSDIVVCNACRRQWHVPEAMLKVLSANAWQLLVEHHDLHSGSSSPFLTPRPQVVVFRPFERRRPKADPKRR